MNGPPPGLCSSCRHQQLVHTTRGSLFSLCRRWRAEPERFTRYPRLPVLECEGYEPGNQAEGLPPAEGKDGRD